VIYAQKKHKIVIENKIKERTVLRVIFRPFLLISIFIFAACQVNIDWQEKLANSVDPVNSLQSDAISKTYTYEYWQVQKKNKSEAWKYARLFCNGHPEYPNCLTIEKINSN